VSVQLVVRGEVADDDLSALHARAFDRPASPTPWRERLERHSLTWILALEGERLVGFVNVAWDGGAHAFLLDTVVDPADQGNGVGRALVRKAAREVARAGCEWLHVDFEEDLASFYLDACGFRSSASGVLRLRE
jgi:ribosomal protein S18 acetylase RimI-like enzyme